MTIKITCDG